MKGYCFSTRYANDGGEGVYRANSCSDLCDQIQEDKAKGFQIPFDPDAKIEMNEEQKEAVRKIYNSDFAKLYRKYINNTGAN